MNGKTRTMDMSDDDVFAMSDNDEVMPEIVSRNPVQEHLLKQQHDIQERVGKANSMIKELKGLTQRVLKKLHVNATCGQSSGSDTESDLYQVTGEPVIKKKRKRSSLLPQPLETSEAWQKVIDNKWIIGIELKNKSKRTLEDPCLYVFVKNERELRGVTSFWEIVEDSLWTRTDELNPDSVMLVATCVLDLPTFEDHEFFDACGTIAYVLDGKPYQTIIPTFRLNANEAIDRSLVPRFSTDPEKSILSIKAVSVEHTLTISVEEDAGMGERLLEFLRSKGIKEIVTDVYVSRNQEAFRHCIFEILPLMNSDATIRISAPSQNQLNVIILMLRSEFPDMSVPNPENKLREAAIALERELNLELSGIDAGGVHMARITTDLLIP